VKRRGPWGPDEIDGFLAGARVPLRLSCNGAAGTPMLASLWFVPEDGLLWCATPRSARVAQRLAEDPRCAFEVAEETAPYRGVRGQGRATLHDDRGAEILEHLIARYLEDPGCDFARWLRGRAADETAIAVAPARLLSWDFGERMGGASAGAGRSRP